MAPYTPKQNGMAERANCIIIEMARTLVSEANLDFKYWGEAVCTAIYLKNRTSTKAVHKMTLEEAWTGRKPTVKHLRPFGCKAYMHILVQKRMKLNTKSIEGIFIGYCLQSKAYQ